VNDFREVVDERKVKIVVLNLANIECNKQKQIKTSMLMLDYEETKRQALSKVDPAQTMQNLLYIFFSN
jgi:hypothetical protein